MYTEEKWGDVHPLAVFLHPENGQRFLITKDVARDGYVLISATGVCTRIDRWMVEQGTDIVTRALRAHLEQELFMRVLIDDTDLYTRVFV